MTNLAHPLTTEQVEAAKTFYGRSNRWRLIDTSLAQLHERIPGYGNEAVFLKTIAIDRTYSTNVKALHAVAAHVSRVLTRVHVEEAGPDLVEEIAAVPTGDGGVRHHRSFASKFASVFIDSNTYPILDGFAEEMLRWHLGPSLVDPDATTPPYVAFERRIRSLIREAALPCSIRELDRYLWLAGLYRRWLANPDSPINTEAARLFAEDQVGERQLGRTIWDPA